MIKATNPKVLLLVILFFCKEAIAQQERKIVLDVSISTPDTMDTVHLQYLPADVLGNPQTEVISRKLVDKHSKFVIYTTQPVYIYAVCPEIDKKYNTRWLVEPGDSINMVYNGKELLFSGKGAEKCKLLYELAVKKRGIKRPSDLNFYYAKSMDDYWECNEYLNNQLAELLPVIDTYHDRISSFAYQYIKARLIDDIESYRCAKFFEIMWKTKEFGLSNKDLCSIFDSAFFSAPAKWMRSLPAGVDGNHTVFIKLSTCRRFSFDLNCDSIKSDDLRLISYYEEAKRLYNGLQREKLLLMHVAYRGMYDEGFTKGTELLLSRYYAEPHYPECKKWVKDFEKNERRNVLTNRWRFPAIYFVDDQGRKFTNKDLLGKVTLMHFGVTNLRDMERMAPALKHVVKTFDGDTNVVFLNIHTGPVRSRKLESIKKAIYTGASSMNLYPEDKGGACPMAEAYLSSRPYPGLYLVEDDGRISENSFPVLEKDNGEELVRLIRKKLVFLNDGPYVFYENNGVKTCSLYGGNLHETKLNTPSTYVTVQDDEFGRNFQVRLKDTLVKEPSEFEKPERVFVMSDIEGELTVLKNMLLVNKIIDADLNWIFGKGHVGLHGDKFDRGKQVTECMWFIYSLEEKAKAAGGYVHFILGNHEIMNLNGDNRYAQQKYKNTADLMGEPYTALYSNNTELGRWLRTKNIMEKIGDLLFIHGGVGKEFSDQLVSIDNVNELARRYYDKDSLARRSGNKALSMIFNPEFSPFWYRSYYLDREMKVVLDGKKGLDTVYRTPEKAIDEILAKFGVKHIVTGHTIINNEDRVTTHFNDKVINTDTRHAAGKSAALEVVDNKYYSTNAFGQKTLLFDENRNYSLK